MREEPTRFGRRFWINWVEVSADLKDRAAVSGLFRSTRSAHVGEHKFVLNGRFVRDHLMGVRYRRYRAICRMECIRRHFI